MKIKELNNHAEWDAFLAGVHPSSFLQSPRWMDFNTKGGSKCVAFGLYDDGRLQGVGLAIEVRARRGNILIMPHGPVLAHPTREQFSLFHNAFIKYAQENGLAWVRVATPFEDSEEHRSWMQKCGYRLAPTHLHSELSWVLDISPPEEEILAGMRKTTRYAIRDAIKAGIEVKIGSSEALLADFRKNYDDTVRRQRFVPYSWEYITRELSTYGEGYIMIGVAYHNGTPLASAIVPYEHGWAFYHHGASGSAERELPAAQLLQWELMREAKRRGCSTYNFWGITEKNFQFSIFNFQFRRHPWYGLTVFKRGFGGSELRLVPTHDYIIDPVKYWPAYVFEKLRHLARGL